MLLSLFNLTVISEWLAFIAAILWLGKKTTIWRLFIPIIFITICGESGGWALIHIFKSRSNGWVFNINLIINVLFSIWLFAHAEPLQKIKKKLIGTMIGFIVFVVCNSLFIQGFSNYQSYTDVTGGIIFIIISCYFFYAVLNEETYRNLFSYEYFWFANGLLFYSLGAVVLFIFYNDISAFDEKTHSDVYGYINYSLNILLYGSLIISFICRNRNTR
jgi:hypothetical protein